MLELLMQSEEYAEFGKQDFFLAHIFKMLDKPNKDIWQVGFYSPSKENMITCMVDGASVLVTPESEVFKKPDSEILKLELDKVSIDWKEALEKAERFISDHYPSEMIITTFFILQRLPLGTVYNLTYMTKSFHTINLKLSAQDGAVLKHSKDSLMDMARFEKGGAKRE